MQNLDTLLELGFEYFPDFDFVLPAKLGTAAIHEKGYRLKKGNDVFKARVVICNGPVYVTLALQSKRDSAKFLLSKDCCSTGSVQRKTENPEKYWSNINS